MVADALDPDQVAEAGGKGEAGGDRPSVTAIGAVDMRHFDRDSR